mmetsp:Transcript_10810/g.20597  ORF Transcript_10810/g.20597 Transcript_10810/m.20597 type:complete len:278 (-) Transcript_10810:302-1135(-)|eukprot:CAMPEP_0197444186 /NCGR_PEP_ID=MMETSP1175-20131217/9723_1 /TAXON_ID=1003142 /ORGANISM="Triceratium dubium, Strain CCMP147" /LENGTH=277 /DNA_ID=CAMNT_0042974927 /DNA_START=336 /DNA_END=1169 /DNA_ORIENTATION=-
MSCQGYDSGDGDDGFFTSAGIGSQSSLQDSFSTMDTACRSLEVSETHPTRTPSYEVSDCAKRIDEFVPGSNSAHHHATSQESISQQRHPLYLGDSWRTFTCAPVVFEGRMSLEECDKRYCGTRIYKYDVGEDSPEEGNRCEATKGLDGDASCSTASTASLFSFSSDSSDGTAPPRVELRTFSVSFSPISRIHIIDSSSTYPHSVRKSLWFTKKELDRQKRAARREREFDGDDWRLTTEESQFVRCSKTGRWVHPAHLAGQSSQRDKEKSELSVSSAA